MAFVDRIVDHPGRVRLTAVSGETDVYDMTREEGEVYTAGTLLNANNLNNPDFTTLAIGGDSVADWVTEQGTNGDWKYRKWHSGKVEAWARWAVGTVAITTGSSAYGGYRSLALNYSIPSGIFSSTPCTVGIKSQSQGGWIANLYATSATQITSFFGSGDSITITDQIIDIYAWEN